MRTPVVRGLWLSLSLSLAVAASVHAQGARSFKSGTIQCSASGQATWVANGDVKSVSRIGTSDVVEYPMTSCSPSSLALREDGDRVFVTCPDDDRVAVLAADGSEVGSIAFRYGASPRFAALSPDQRTLVVTLNGSGQVALIDTTGYGIRTIVTTYRQPLGIAWEPDGSSFWITHGGSDGQATRVSRLSAIGTVTASLRLGPQEPHVSTPTDIAEGGSMLLRGGLAVRPGTRELWLPAQLLAVDDPYPTPDSTAQSTLQVIGLDDAKLQLARRVVLTAVAVHDVQTGEYAGPGFDAHVSGPVDIAWSRDGAKAWVVHESSNDLLEYPVSALSRANEGTTDRLREVAVGDRPMGVVVLPNARIAYVQCSLGRDVALVDLDRMVTVAHLGASRQPEPLQGDKLLGAKVFFRSDLPQISSNAKVACATCHPDGGSDGLIWNKQFLPANLGPRTTTSLLGLSRTFGEADPATHLGQLHRSGDSDEIQDFDFAFRGVQMGGTGFIANIADPLAGTVGYYGDDNSGQDENVDAMAHYVLDLKPPIHSPERGAGGSMSPAAKRGAAIFQGNGTSLADAKCASCHDPQRGFVDLKFHDVGSPRSPFEREIRERVPEWNVNTTGLAGIFATPPYDRGCVEGTQRQSLVDAVHDLALSSGHGRVDQLSQRQQRDLAAYVGSLDYANPVGLRDDQAPHLVRVHAISLTRIVAWFDEAVDPATASAISNWSVTSNGQQVPIEQAEWDPISGDRVILHVSLPRGCADQTYVVTPGAILDAAAQVTGRTANRLDVGDPSNTHVFQIGDSITVTMGAGSSSDIVVPVNDAGMAGPGDPERMLDSPWMRRDASGASVMGFVSLDWIDAFVSATGVTDPSRLLDASLSVQPAFGVATQVSATRVLRAWSDVHQGDGAAVPGALSWQYSSAPQGWAVPGAGARGGTGNAVTDYGAAFDVAGSPDAVAVVADLSGRVALGGPGLLQAERFWLQNPSLNYGHALEISSGELRLERSEDQFGDLAPVLTLTYALPSAPRAAAEISGPASIVPLRAMKTGATQSLTFEDAGDQVEALVGDIGAFQVATGARCLQATAVGAGVASASIDFGSDEWFVVVAKGPCGGSAGAGSTGIPRPTWSAACTP